MSGRIIDHIFLNSDPLEDSKVALHCAVCTYYIGNLNI